MSVNLPDLIETGENLDNQGNRWVFTQEGRDLKIEVTGPFTSNSIATLRDAALSGLGLAYLPVSYVKNQLDSGTLV